MNKALHYCIGVLITIAFYILSRYLGSFVNVVTAMANGYATYSAFANSENIGGLLFILVFGFCNHIIFAWLTVKLTFAYAKKKNCVSPTFFLCSSIAVIVYSLFVLPLLSLQTPGWMSFVVHACAVFFFGKKRILKSKKAESSAASTSANQSSGHDDTDEPIVFRETSSRQIARYCSYCGAELKDNSNFCHKCGERVV